MYEYIFFKHFLLCLLISAFDSLLYSNYVIIIDAHCYEEVDVVLIVKTPILTGFSFFQVPSLFDIICNNNTLNYV